VALAQELFENTVEDDIAREIIVEYFVCFIEYIRDTPEVKELLRKGGDFPAALVSRVAMRL
jgi:L-lysine 2,3-aminomutase